MLSTVPLAEMDFDNPHDSLGGKAEAVDFDIHPLGHSLEGGPAYRPMLRHHAAGYPSEVLPGRQDPEEPHEKLPNTRISSREHCCLAAAHESYDAC